VLPAQVVTWIRSVVAPSARLRRAKQRDSFEIRKPLRPQHHHKAASAFAEANVRLRTRHVLTLPLRLPRLALLLLDVGLDLQQRQWTIQKIGFGFGPQLRFCIEPAGRRRSAGRASSRRPSPPCAARAKRATRIEQQKLIGDTEATADTLQRQRTAAARLATTASTQRRTRTPHALRTSEQTHRVAVVVEGQLERHSDLKHMVVRDAIHCWPRLRSSRHQRSGQTQVTVEATVMSTATELRGRRAQHGNSAGGACQADPRDSTQRQKAQQG
jgi:hypothetical protein